MADVNRDLIATTIEGPIDWGVLEQLFSAVLIADDMPTLRPIGGVGDGGVDAIEESFHDGERRIRTIVQITSDRAQRGKVRGTIDKLRKNGIDVKNLIFATRHPVSNDIRLAIINEAEEDGVTVDIRDDKYLIAQLSLPGSPLFLRFFGSVRAQFDALLATPDPLKTTSEPLQHALLASMGAFVLSKHAGIARNTLFDKSVLAVIATATRGISKAEICEGLEKIYPGESIDHGRIQAAVDRLDKEGSIVKSGDCVSCVQAVIEQFLEVGKQATNAFQALLGFVVAGCRKVRALDDAQLGYIERNVRSATLTMLRAAGPIGAASYSAGFNERELSEQIARSLPPDVGRAALLAFSTFTGDHERAKVLAPLARSYSALAIRNLDPYGKKWQQNVLSRSDLVLDTDALLSLIIEELPEHAVVLSSLRSLVEAGVKVVVPNHVLDEAVAHIGRANRTFARFSETLLRLPPAVVDAKVWHTVVRGYYYAVKGGVRDYSAEKYWNKYWNAEAPRKYIEHLLARRLKLHLRDLDEAHIEDMHDLYQLEIAALEVKERSRMKAKFRDSYEMSARVRRDIAMALNLARANSEQVGAQAAGYLVTSDRAFHLVEKDANWNGRPSVVLNTTSLASLAAFVCGNRLSNDQIVGLLFHPVAIAAADQIGGHINVLAAVGVDLMDVPLDRLDWDLRNRLQAGIEEIGAALAGEQDSGDGNVAMASLGLAGLANQMGYRLAEPVQELVSHYNNAVSDAAEEKRLRIELEEKIRRFVVDAKDTTKKGRSRINRIVRSLGLEGLVSEEPVEPEEGE